MQVSLEKTEGLKRRLTYVVPAQRLEEEVQKRLKDLAKRVNIKGYRPGKVPVKVVEQHYGKDIRQDALNQLMHKGFVEAIEQESIKPAGEPQITPGVSTQEDELGFEATFEVFPEIELIDLSTLTVEKPTAEIKDDDVDRMIEKLRKQQVKWNSVDREAQMGDQLKISFVGKIDNEAFEGGTAENYDLELGDGRMIPGFEEGLVGVKAGEDCELKVRFPDDYHHSDFAGKEAIFETKVIEVNAPSLPDIDKEFMALYGVDDGDTKKFRDEIRKTMQQELDNIINTKTKSSVLDRILEAHNIELPMVLVNQELQHLVSEMRRGENKTLPPITEELNAALMEKAKQRVSLGLLFTEYIKHFDVKLDEDRVRSEIERMASVYDRPEQVVAWYYGEKERLASVQSVVLEDQVVDKILDQVTLSEKPFSYEELVNQA